jgi:hypothetical protein
MANNSVKAQAKNQIGTEFTIEHHQSDSPLLSVEKLEQLHNFRPELVDWYIKETEKESQYRRSTRKEVNRFVFTEKILGQIFGMIVGVSGIIGGSYVALQGQSIAGASIATVAIGSLAVAFVIRSQKH